jgi:serine/threonine protein kinase
MALAAKLGVDLWTLASSESARRDLLGWPIASAAYTIEGILGRGTFGLVLRARRHPSHWQSSAAVAIKVTPRASRSASRELSVMLRLASAGAAASGVIQLQEYFFATSGASKLILCQVLPLFDTSLRSHVDNASDRLGPAGRIALARSVGSQLAAALSHIHHLRISHRDVKPENILVRHLEANGNVRCVLADFGSAKVHNAPGDARGNGATQKSVPYVCGIQYRAPELLFGCTTYTCGSLRKSNRKCRARHGRLCRPCGAAREAGVRLCCWVCP